MKSNFIYKITACIFLFISTHCLALNCPSSNNQTDSLLTINGYGNSTYENEIDFLILKKMSGDINIKSLSPVLDVGAGFGAFSYNAIKHGVNSIYLNDLSNDNLSCSLENIQKHLQTKDVDINLIKGDINKTKALDKIPDNSLGMIHAGNVIHFFKFTDLAKFIQTSHQKLKPDGYLFLTFENKFLSEQRNMMERIKNTVTLSESKTEQSIHHIIEKEYLTTSFGFGKFHCSITSYSKLPASWRYFGFPCQINRTENPMMEKYQPFENHLLLDPELLAIMLEKSGFGEISIAGFNNETGAYAILAKKLK